MISGCKSSKEYVGMKIIKWKSILILYIYGYNKILE